MKRYYPSFCALVLAVALVAGCGGESKDVVADVAGKKITAGDLLILYDNISPPNRPPFTTLEEKKAFLETVISKEILLKEAEDRQLGEQSEVIAGVASIGEQRLLRRIFNEKAQKAVEITPEALEEHYQATQSQIRLLDIWIAGEPAKAQAVLDQIRGGADFAEMARKHSENEYAAAGGDLGWQIVSEPSLGFFREALEGMEVGDVSDLITIPTGNHILMLAEKNPADMAEFEKKLIKVRQSLRQKLQGQLWKEYVTDLSTRKNVTPEPEGIAFLRRTFEDVPNAEMPQLSEQDMQRALVTYTGGTYKVADLYLFLNSVGRGFRPNMGQSEFDLTNWIVGRATSHVVLQTAKEMGLDQEHEYKDALARRREELMLNALHADLVKDVTVSDEELRAYFDENRESFRFPGRARVRYIFTTAPERADSAYREIESGVPFVNVVPKYSEDPNTKDKGGVIDSLFAGTFNTPDMDDAIFALNAGESTRPILYNQGYYLFHMLKKERGELQSFEDAAPSLREVLLNNKQVETFDSWLEQRRVSLDIQIFDDALNAIIAEESGV